ncbi:hypothetical protein SNL152K_2330 [Streptomyces sp. NL15-2K]|nr:hypothetical protein SNL152K_2330 [Streptomyces sp. NL15-2K]
MLEPVLMTVVVLVTVVVMPVPHAAPPGYRCLLRHHCAACGGSRRNMNFVQPGSDRQPTRTRRLDPSFAVSPTALSGHTH